MRKKCMLACPQRLLLNSHFFLLKRFKMTAYVFQQIMLWYLSVPNFPGSLFILGLHNWDESCGRPVEVEPNEEAQDGTRRVN
jgi:hypothetical protein